MTGIFPEGKRINQYEIKRFLGKGVYAEVYVAHHTLLGTDRVLKALRKDEPELEQLFGHYCQRYENEWRLAAEIDSPRLLKLHDLFEADEGLFAVLEWAKHGTLRGKMNTPGIMFDQDWVINSLLECAKALAELHNSRSPRLAHCYVEPGCILFDEEDAIKISNFGRARVRGTSGAAPQEETHYQAPEFKSGYAAPTSDVYSLGCIAFELLTGKSRALAENPSPLENGAYIDDWFDRIVVRMLSEEPGISRRSKKDPNKRYVDMEHLLEELQPSIDAVIFRKIENNFSLDELKGVVFELGVDADEIAGSNKSAYIREMITYFGRRGRADELRKILRAKRDNLIV